MCRVDCPQMLCESASVWESPTAAPTDVRFCPRMSDLVGTESLLCFEWLAALCAHMPCDGLRLVDDLVRVESRGGLKRFSTRGAGERALWGVHRQVHFQIASIHKCTTAEFTDVARGVGRVTALVSTQQRSCAIAPGTLLQTVNTSIRKQIEKQLGLLVVDNQSQQVPPSTQWFIRKQNKMHWLKKWKFKKC